MASKPRRITCLVNLLLMAAAATVIAAMPLATAAQQTPATQSSPPEDIIQELGNNYQNSITLLQNRFRVDHNVDEVTMVFFREYGSAPVVLVRPDGSKIFQTRAEQENAQWFDADTYDMITIKNPVPGPWQAVGQIKPDSRIMVVSDIALNAPSLPTTLFSGEILKQTATLTNGAKPIAQADFRRVVELQIELISTDNPNYDNFKAENQVIATFEDNGRGMDERPGDGVFTGQFNLSIEAGEWTPVFSVTTPMFSREQAGSAFVLHKNPISLRTTLAHDKTEDAENYHTLHIDVDKKHVDVTTLLIDGKVRYPNGDVHTFSLTEPTAADRYYNLVALDKGKFTVKLTAYGKTTEDRDFILNVPEYSFEVLPEPPAVIDEPASAQASAVIDSEAMPLPELAASANPGKESPESMSQNTLMLTLALVNGTILLIVGLVVAFVLWRRKNGPGTDTRSPVSDINNNDNPSANSMFTSLKARVMAVFQKKPKEGASD